MLKHIFKLSQGLTRTPQVVIKPTLYRQQLLVRYGSSALGTQTNDVFNKFRHIGINSLVLFNGAARSTQFHQLHNMMTIRQFHAMDSKIHYLDYRYRNKSGKLKLHLKIIRKQKMRKHQLKKWRKKFKCLLSKQRLAREIAKEKAFRVELLTMIREAEQFDPREYALRKIAEVNSVPKPISKEERLEELKVLIRKNRYQVTYVKPKHRTCESLDASHYHQ